MRRYQIVFSRADIDTLPGLDNYCFENSDTFYLDALPFAQGICHYGKKLFDKFFRFFF